MISKREENWKIHFNELKDHVAITGHFPDKHSTLNNWVRYQRKRIKAGLMTEEQQVLFEELAANRSMSHTGGGTYSEGSRVNVTATPKSGYAFDKWSDGNTSASRTINVSKNERFVAQFKVADSTETGGSGDDDTPDYI